MKRTDLILVAPVKYGGWMIKNPSVAQIGHTQNGVTGITIKNGACYLVELYTRNPDAALEQLAEIIESQTGIVRLDVDLKYFIATEAEYFGHEEGEDESNG
jgi:hypothetical protein